MLFPHNKQRQGEESLLPSSECFPGDPVFSESRISLQVCAAHAPRFRMALGVFIYVEGPSHGETGPGARRRRETLGRPASRPGLTHSPACPLSHEAPLLRGVSAVGTVPAARPLPGEAAQRCPAGVRQPASFLKVLLSFPSSRRGEEEELFPFKFLSLYVDTRRKLSTGHVRMLKGFADKQQPPGTRGLK